jgi:integrase
MSVYKRKYRDATGKLRKSSRFTAEFVYRGKLHREGGFPDKDSALQWVNTESLRLRRGGKGYVKPMLAEPIRPLIDTFVQHLRTHGRDDMYCTVAGQRLRRLCNECAWLNLGDIDAASAEAWKTQPSYWRGRPKQPVSNKSKNQMMQMARQFCAWLVKPMAKLATNPLVDVTPLPHRDNAEYRRAATVDELNKLLATCSPQRHVYYRFRVYHSKIRSDTLAHTTWRMVHLDATPPFIKTPAHINKSRREEKHVLRYDIAQELRKLRKRAKADDLVFPNPPILGDLRADLIAAGIATDDGKGNRRLDFHALRATFVGLAKAAGMTPWEVMELLGHRSIQTTLRFYNKDTAPQSHSDAMEKLPTLGQVRKAQ